MKTYICHKLVRAEKINNFDILTKNGGCSILLESGNVMCFDSDFFARYKPITGDYLVVYEDGDTSVSPKDVFEKGYSLKDSDKDALGNMRKTLEFDYDKASEHQLLCMWEREYERRMKDEYENTEKCIKYANAMIDAIKEKFGKK